MCKLGWSVCPLRTREGESSNADVRTFVAKKMTFSKILVSPRGKEIEVLRTRERRSFLRFYADFNFAAKSAETSVVILIVTFHLFQFRTLLVNQWKKTKAIMVGQIDIIYVSPCNKKYIA